MTADLFQSEHPRPVLVKLGGSVITEKDTPETVDDTALQTAVDAIATTAQTRQRPLVLVHGGGSFGHHHASTHNVSPQRGTQEATAVTAIHNAMTQLNRAVIDRLQAHELPAVPVRPLSLASRDADGTLQLPRQPIVSLLQEGFLPVIHGDVIADVTHGATILSGDTIVAHLGETLQADRIGVCSNVPGVFDETGAVIDRIESLESVETALSASDTTDVSGGMAGKVKTLLATEPPASIFGLTALSAFLSGDSPGTTIAGN